MRVLNTISLVAFLGALTGCYPPTQTDYTPAAVEAPQSVHFYYGTLIDRRPATLAYGNSAGIGAAYFPTSPYFAGLQVAAKGNIAGIGAAFGGIGVLAGGIIPNLPATEFTVCLNGGTYPPDPSYIRPGPSAVIVVQNDYPNNYDNPDGFQNDRDLQPGRPVMVRVVGTSGRVMRVKSVAGTVSAQLRKPVAATVSDGQCSVYCRRSLDAGSSKLPAADLRG